MRSTYGAPHTFLPADERDFPHLNLAQYQKVRAELATKGFRHVADIEIMEATMAPHSTLARTFISCHLSDNGICASHDQAKPKRLHLLRFLIGGIYRLRWISAPRTFLKYIHSRHCLALETEFNDNSYVVTGNAEVAAMISQPPTVDVEYHPFGTPMQHLLERHTARIESLLRSTSCCAKRKWNPRIKWHGVSPQLRNLRGRNRFRILVAKIAPHVVHHLGHLRVRHAPRKTGHAFAPFEYGIGHISCR